MYWRVKMTPRKGKKLKPDDTQTVATASAKVSTGTHKGLSLKVSLGKAAIGFDKVRVHVTVDLLQDGEVISSDSDFVTLDT
jgi:hypothetical protein